MSKGVKSRSVLIVLYSMHYPYVRRSTRMLYNTIKTLLLLTPSDIPLQRTMEPQGIRSAPAEPSRLDDDHFLVELQRKYP